MRGQNVEYAAEVTLEEAFQGTTRLLDLQSQAACATCGGSGQIAGAVCHVCEGTGAVVRPKRVEVKIPAGVQDGSRVRIAGEGRTGAAGGPRGDLYVVVRVRPHSRFERRGADLVTEAGVALEDAVLGGEVEVQTLSGKHVALKLPPLTQNGRVFRLAGLGMPRLDDESGRTRPAATSWCACASSCRSRSPTASASCSSGCARSAASRRRARLMVDERSPHEDEPLFVISIAAKMIGMHAQCLRHYERLGLVRPSRSRGRVRLYSQADIERLRHIQRLVNDLGVNLAGAEVVIRLNERIRRMEEEMEHLRAELQSYRDRVLPATVEGEGVDDDSDRMRAGARRPRTDVCRHPRFLREDASFARANDFGAQNDRSSPQNAKMPTQRSFARRGRRHCRSQNAGMPHRARRSSPIQR